MANERDAFGELRRRFDSNDPFMTGGHRLLKMRRYQRSVPEWARSDEEVRKLLLRSFPKLQDNDLQRKRAAVWTRVIHLYFRLGYTYSYVAGEMELSDKKIENVVQAIHYAASGKTAKGRPRKRKS